MQGLRHSLERIGRPTLWAGHIAAWIRLFAVPLTRPARFKRSVREGTCRTRHVSQAVV